MGTVSVGGEVAGEKDAVRDEKGVHIGDQTVLSRDSAEDGRTSNFLALFGISRGKEG